MPLKKSSESTPDWFAHTCFHMATRSEYVELDREIDPDREENAPLLKTA